MNTPSMPLIISQILNRGSIGVLATDTLYGVVGQALKPAVVERIYQLKQRRPTKPFIILIHTIDDLALFDITLSPKLHQHLKGYWPGAVSVILPCPGDKFAYLHRGTNSLAFRLPAKPSLRRLIGHTGPLVAPSANPEGLAPAATLAAARAYFGDNVDFYRRGRTTTRASKIIQIDGEHIQIVRR